MQDNLKYCLQNLGDTMKFKTNLRNLFIIIFATLALSACSTAKKSDVSGDVYTGSDTVEYLASGVKDRVFFSYDSAELSPQAKEILDLNDPHARNILNQRSLSH